MSITLSKATESLLTKQALDQGSSESKLADSILYGVLAESLQTDFNDTEEIREALEQEKAGRYRPFRDYVAEHRQRYPQPIL